MLVQPLEFNKTKVILLANADPKLSLIPYSLLNLVTKNLAHFAFTVFQVEFNLKNQTFANKAENLEGTPYQQKIESNPELYGEGCCVLQWLICSETKTGGLL